MRIFISYGHDEHLSFARQLAEAFESRNYEVWFDETRLTGGKPWEEYIEKGLRWVAEDKNGRMILIMTPHSVRRPNGYCLNELAYALDLHLPVLPIMLVWTTPPLSIYRYQWIDLTHPDGNVSFADDFSKIIRAIEADNAPDIDESYHIKKCLDPLDYSNDMVLYQPLFVGREWLFDDFERWLSDADASRVYYLVGLPGIGKTSIAVRILQTYENVMAFHLFRRGNSEKMSTRRVICSLAYQISQQLPEYFDYLLRVDLTRELERCNDVALFDVLLSTPLYCCEVPRAPKVILLDALDEAGDEQSVPFASFLSNALSKLPGWIRIVITSRPVEAVLFPLQQFEPHIISAESAQNIADLSLYVSRRLSEKYGDKAPNGASIVNRSEGIFLYAKYVCDELLPDSPSDFDESILPQGISAVYYNFFVEYYPDITAYRTNIGPILEVISAQVEPLTPDMIADCLGIYRDIVEDFEVTFQSLFFRDREERIRPYHSSILEWVLNRQLSGRFSVNQQRGADSIARWLFGVFEESGWDFFAEGKTGYLLENWMPVVLDRTSILQFDEKEVLSSYLDQIKDKSILALVADRQRFHFIKSVFSYIFMHSVLPVTVIDDVYAKHIEGKTEKERQKEHSIRHAKGLKYLFELVKNGSVVEPNPEKSRAYFLDVQLPLFYTRSSYDPEYLFKALSDGLLSAFEDDRVSAANGFLLEIHDLGTGSFSDSWSVAVKYLEKVADIMEANGWDDGMWANRTRSIAKSIREKNCALEDPGKAIVTLRSAY